MDIVGRRFSSFKELYEAIPNAQCQGLCADSCGPIGASDLELRRAKKAGVNLMTAAHRLIRLDVSQVNVPIPMCSALVEGRCSIYDLRPTICRVWGVSEEMPCVFGCEPDHVLTPAESEWLVMESLRLGGPITAPELMGYR